MKGMDSYILILVSDLVPVLLRQHKIDLDLDILYVHLVEKYDRGYSLR